MLTLLLMMIGAYRSAADVTNLLVTSGRMLPVFLFGRLTFLLDD